MTKTHQTVKDGMVVGLEYVLRLDDGEVVVSSERRGDMEYVQGYGQMVPGLEQALQGMSVGEEKHVVVEPEEGFGPVDPEAYVLVARDVFPADLGLKPGMRVRMRDQSGEIVSAEVMEEQDRGVLLDFNHALAGERLHFDVKVTSLRQASGDELAQAAHVGPDAS